MTLSQWNSLENVLKLRKVFFLKASAFSLEDFLAYAPFLFLDLLLCQKIKSRLHRAVANQKAWRIHWFSHSLIIYYHEIKYPVFSFFEEEKNNEM